MAASPLEIAFAILRNQTHISLMSTVQEVQDALRGMSPEDRNRVKAFLLHLSRVDDPVYQAEISRRRQEIENGQGVSSAELEKIHQDLCRQGR